MKATIAHVGHTKTRSDFMRVAEAMEWLQARGESWPEESDFIDLHRKRDFLAEDKKYKFVILHFIFRGGWMVTPEMQTGGLRQSPLACWSSWRKRLIQTGAKYIFAFGGAAEVSGTYIAIMEGYKIHKVRTEDMQSFGNKERGHQGLWIFEKE